MKIKKVMSLALAMIMALALAVPALADDPTVAMTGATQIGTVAATVDGNSNMVFNPSKLSVKVGTSGTIADNGVQSNEQIIANPIKVTNKSTLPLALTATFGVVVGAAEGATPATVSTSAISATESAKKVMATADFAVSDADAFADVPEFGWLTASQLVGTPMTEAESAYTGGKTHTAAQAVQIPATDGSAEHANYVYVKFGGAATKAPATPWASSDTVKLVTIFKFLPQAVPENRILIATQPESSNAFAALSSTGTPTFNVTYSKTALTAANLGPKQSGSNKDKNIFKTADDAVAYPDTSVIVYPNFMVKITPLAGTTSGTYYAISSVTFRNEDGTTNTAVKATKVGKNSDAYYTFTMPDCNIQAIVTVASTAS